MPNHNYAHCTRVVVVGPSNLDIYVYGNHTRESLEYVVKTEFAPGGTARNVAENLARLGVPTTLVTQLWKDDTLSEFVRRRTSETGVYVVSSEVSGGHLPVYIALINPNGQTTAEMIDPSFPSSNSPLDIWPLDESVIQDSDLLILSSSVSDALFESLADFASSKANQLWVVVSAHPMADKVARWASQIDLLSLNYLEASVLLRHQVETLDAARDAVHRLLEFGIPTVLLTLAAEGIILGTQEGIVHLPSITPPMPVVSTSGAGDACIAGLACGLLHGESPIAAANWGLAAASWTLCSQTAVNPALNLERVKQLALGQG